MPCTECRTHVDHCHGTLVVSTDETWCTGPDCADHDVARHTLWISLTEPETMLSATVSAA